VGYSILLVDDSTTIRKVLVQVFEMTKLPLDEVLQAADGIEALDLLKNNWVDIVFCDINMPRMNGVELIRKMREHPEISNIPVVVISTEGSATRKEELESIGIDGYLRKPCRPEEVRDVIYQLIGEWENDGK
jgi:two-component system, chemotaxis family, chemotaxis protein CheY